MNNTNQTQPIDNDELYLLANAVEKGMIAKFYSLDEVEQLFPIMNKYKNIVESIKRKDKIINAYKNEIKAKQKDQQKEQKD